MVARVIALHNAHSGYQRYALILALLLLLTALLTTASSVRAAETNTQTFQNATFVSDPDANPCTGARTRTTLVVNGVLHSTDLAAGRHARSTQVVFDGIGTFRIVPDNPRLPTYSARRAWWPAAPARRTTR